MLNLIGWNFELSDKVFFIKKRLGPGSAYYQETFKEVIEFPVLTVFPRV